MVPVTTNQYIIQWVYPFIPYIQWVYPLLIPIIPRGETTNQGSPADFFIQTGILHHGLGRVLCVLCVSNLLELLKNTTSSKGEQNDP